MNLRVKRTVLKYRTKLIYKWINDLYNSTQGQNASSRKSRSGGGVHERSSSVDNLLPAVDEVDSSGGGGYEGGGGGVNQVAQPPEGARVPPGT